MKRVLAFFLCIVFNFVAIGGNIYVHICKDSFIVSLYERIGAEACPICVETHHHHDHNDGNHCHGECKNEIVKIDQLKHQDFSNNNQLLLKISPVVLSLPWINMDFNSIEEVDKSFKTNFVYAAVDSSPPIYIQHCTYRI